MVNEIPSQGKELNKQEVLNDLEPFFIRGLSVQKACDLAGYTAQTVYRWLRDDPQLARSVRAKQNVVLLNALTHKLKGVEEGKASDVDWILSRSRRIRDEFAERQEVTGAYGAAPTPLIPNIRKKEEPNSEVDKPE